MRILFTLALLLSPVDEPEAARDALTKALTALDRYNVDRACTTLVRLADERTPEFFIATFRAGLLQIADALAAKTAGSEDARKVLLPWLQTGVWGSRLAAVQALMKSGDKKLVPLIIPVLQGASGRMRFEINECLKKLTSVNKHGDYTAWQTWWDKNENEFLGGTYVPSLTDKADLPGQTQFYGIPLHSTKVIFIIDVSLSMKETSAWKPEITDGIDKLEGDRSIDIARYELRRIIRSIQDGASFNVIGMYGRLAMLSDKWVIAAKDNREKSIKFVQNLEIRPGTDVHGAL